MTIKTSAELKLAFGSGEYPSSADYADLVDTVFDQPNQVDISGLATETYVNNSVSGLATETYVNNSVSGLATETYVNNSVSALIDSAPGALNTLNELAAALNNDANFAGTITLLLAGKADVAHNHDDRYYTKAQVDELSQNFHPFVMLG